MLWFNDSWTTVRAMNKILIIINNLIDYYDAKNVGCTFTFRWLAEIENWLIEYDIYWNSNDSKAKAKDKLLIY